MSRTTRPVMQLDSQARPLPTSGDWTAFRGAYVAGTQNIEYSGFAKPGTAEGELRWQICRMTYDALNNITAIQWPVNASGAVSNDFEFSWTARAGYTYV